ncbi:MAG: hypothetical protein JW993_12290 [Sedimentisphaerales bacterium]|nr:hypothetical protein [Sedimentisphaerales bacterium]
MKERFAIVTILALVVGVLAPSAHAGLVLTLDDGTTSVTVSDGDLDGVVTYNGTIGNWTINNTMGISKPAIGIPSVAVLHLHSFDATSSAGGTLMITLYDDGYTLEPPEDWKLMTSDVGGVSGGTVSFSQIYENAQGYTETLYHGPFGVGAFADTQSAWVPYVEPFSLTEVAVITHAGKAETSFDLVSTVVPVPAALLLGALGLGVAGIRLRKHA